MCRDWIPACAGMTESVILSMSSFRRKPESSHHPDAAAIRMHSAQAHGYPDDRFFEAMPC